MKAHRYGMHSILPTACKHAKGRWYIAFHLDRDGSTPLDERLQPQFQTLQQAKHWLRDRFKYPQW